LKGGGDRCAPAPTRTSCPCSHPLQLCICPRQLSFLLAPVLTYCPFAPVHRLYLFVVHARSLFVSAPTCWPRALLVVQSVGRVRSFGCAFVCAHAHCRLPSLSLPVPTYSPCALSVIHAHAQLPCSCVSAPAVVGCNTLCYLSHIISI
jgi:hypothetical protein